jgi:Carboxypeptidase regulatory-like domain
MSRLIRAVLFAAALLPVAAHAQVQHVIVRGRVTSDSGRVVPGAAVVVSRRSDTLSRRTQSDASGEYTVDWPAADVQYTLVVSAPSFQQYTANLTRPANDSVLVANVVLRAIQRLAPVVSQAARPVIDRDPGAFGAGGSESATVPQNAARRLGPDLAGDLTAIAGMLPGVALTASGISVLGLPSSQNAITLGGLAFAGSDVPRDAATRIRVQTSSYDPSNGWFSGAQTAVDLNVGDQFTSRTTHLTADAPALEYNDRISSRLGQRFTNFNASLGGNGQLVDDRWAYNYGVQGGRRAATLSSSLVNADDDVLRLAGVARDSAVRFLNLLRQAGIPTSVSGLPNGAIDDNVSFIARVDHAPYDWTKLAYNPTSYGLQAYAKWGHTQAQGVSPIGTPAHGGSTTQGIGALTALFTRTFGPGYLADVRSGLTATKNTSDPYLSLPDGRALVASTFPDASGGVSTLQFGGNSAMSSTVQSLRWESTAQVQLYPAARSAHRLKLSADARFDSYSQELRGNELGTFSYNSLADLATNRPASFTRTLTAPTRTGGEWNGYLAAGDLWRVNPQWQVLYGARLDANTFTSAPRANPVLASALGVQNDNAPSTIALSPRLGVTWQDGKGKILRGGIGQFRNLIDPSLLAAPSVSTGLADGLLRISCIGSAVPTPDWNAFGTSVSNIPSQCVGSSGILSDGAPNVQYVDRSFQPTRSWRSNIGFQSSALRNVYTIELLGSLNLNQPGTVDNNFTGTQAFMLPAEARPVFVAPSAIVSSSGLVSPTGARRAQSFGRVVDVVSDLRSQSAQAVFTLRPYIPNAVRPYFGDVALTYTLSDIRARQRGFDGATFGNPALEEWARGDLDARHLLVAQWVFRPLGDGRLIAFIYGRAQSGLPFTPMVGTDINGDGLANDRAYIFAPTSTADTATASGIRNLLVSSSPRVRDCLLAQAGRVADRNSCEGPWTASMNIGLRMSGQQLLHTPRMDVSLNLTNPLGGLDQLLHGANSLHGWGTAAAPDRTLYTVRGFDPATNRFLYTVNPRFGSTNPSSSTLRAPFRLTLDVQLDVARSIPEQQLDRWLRPGRAGRPGPKLPAAEFMRRYQRTVPDPYGELLQATDSLLLSNDQITRIQTVRTTYRARVDAMWTALCNYLGSLEDTYDFDAVAKRTDDTIDEIWEITRLDVQKNLGEILAPAQTALLGGWAGQLFRARDRLHIRLSPRGG